MLKYEIKEQLQQQVIKAAYTNGVICYAIVNTQLSGGGEYDFFEQGQHTIATRYPFPCSLDYTPKQRYMEIGGGLVARTAQASITGIPYSFLPLLTNSRSVEVPDSNQANFTEYEVLEINVDENELVFQVYLSKRE
jgi:hypothetical protein